MTTEERFWSKVDKDGLGGCWLWTAGTNGWGYGSFWNGTASVGAHVFAYESTIGQVPAGLTIDHLCENKRCCNPAHMEPVTAAENTRRAHTRTGPKPGGGTGYKRRTPQPPPYLRYKDRPSYGVFCLCGCGKATDGWLYMRGHAPSRRSEIEALSPESTEVSP